VVIANDKYVVFVSGLQLWITADSLWDLAKSVRIAILGPYCEICGEEFEIKFPSKKLVGHHIRRLREESARLNGDKRYIEDHWSNCMLRHYACEKGLHKKFKDGNSDDSLKKQKSNNGLILEIFCDSKNLFHRRYHIPKVRSYRSYCRFYDYQAKEAENLLKRVREDSRVYGIDYLLRTEKSLSPYFIQSQNLLAESPA